MQICYSKPGKMIKLVSLYLFLIVLFSCSSTRPQKNKDTITNITFLHEYVIPHGLQYKNTTVGGLSGIDYNQERKEYFMISDDRSQHNPARFYTAQILLEHDKIDTVIFTDVTGLRDKLGNLYPNDSRRPDPEAMRYLPVNHEFIWTSEGERKVDEGIFINPSINRMNNQGVLNDTFEIPNGFQMGVSSGPRQNGVFEGITFSGDFKKSFISMEESLLQDGPSAGIKDSTAMVRILEYDTRSGKNTAQYAYQIEPVAHPPFPPGSFRVNGISDILWINDSEFIIVERSYSTGRISCTIKVFLASIAGATDVTNVRSLQEGGFKPMTKKLLLNMDDLGRFVDNIEGVTFGPLLQSGKQSLIFISDDNFNSFQKTQLFLFEVD